MPRGLRAGLSRTLLHKHTHADKCSPHPPPAASPASVIACTAELSRKNTRNSGLSRSVCPTISDHQRRRLASSEWSQRRPSLSTPWNLDTRSGGQIGGAGYRHLACLFVISGPPRCVRGSQARANLWGPGGSPGIGTTPDSHVARPVLRQPHPKCHSSVLTAGRPHEASAAWAPVPNFFRRRGNKHGEFDMRRARRRPHAGYSATRRTSISKRLRRHPDSLLLVRTQAAANRRGGNFGGRDTHSVMASQSSGVIVRSQTLCIGFALAPPRV